MKKGFFAVLLFSCFLMEDAYGGAKEDRISAATRLTSQLENSKIRNFQIQIYAKGKNCDIMHIRSLNLLPTMMEALATGNLIYGSAIPGGVNSYAKQNGFKAMLYTSRADDSFVSYGNSSLTGPEIERMKACTASDSSPTEKTASPGNAAIKGKRLVTKIHRQYKIHKFYAEANRQGSTMVLWLPAVAWKKLTTEQKDSIKSYVKTSYPNAKCGIGVGRVDGVDITSDDIIPIN